MVDPIRSNRHSAEGTGGTADLAVLRVTTRERILLGVVVLPLHDPVMIAERIAVMT